MSIYKLAFSHTNAHTCTNKMADPLAKDKGHARGFIRNDN